jgi:hypothetical protein
MPDDRTRWRQLGDELNQRRVQLGHNNLPKFKRETPGSPSYSVLTAIEDGRKSSYSRTIKHQIELMYRLKFGTIDRFVAGDIDVLEVLDDDDRGRLRIELQRRGVAPGDLKITLRTLSALDDLVSGALDDALPEEFQAVAG